MTEPVKMCHKGLHEMVGSAVGVQASTGRLYCKQCKLDYKRNRRAKAGKCPANKHSWLNADSWYTTPTGQRRCKRCYFEKQAAREVAAEAAAAALAAAAAAAARVPPRQRSRTMSPRGGGSSESNERDARYRLALIVRQGATDVGG